MSKKFHVLNTCPCVGFSLLLWVLSECAGQPSATATPPEPTVPILTVTVPAAASTLTSTGSVATGVAPQIVVPTAGLRAATPDATLVLPDCIPPVEVNVDTPANFAPSFPFPPGTKLYKWQTNFNDPNHITVFGYTPLDLKQSVQFLIGALPKAGYVLGQGDSEAGEAESQFIGNGWQGGWKVRSVPGCKQGSQWIVVTLKR